MIYTIERRKGRYDGSLLTWYEVRSYTHKSKHTGCLLNGKTLAEFNTKKEAEKFCKEFNIEIV